MHSEHLPEIFEDGFRTALRPAQPLPVEADQGFGHQYPAKGAGFVADAVTCGLRFPGDVYVFGNHVFTPAAQLQQDVAAQAEDDAGECEQHARNALGVFDQADDRAEFGHLQFAEQGAAVAYARIAGQPAEIGVCFHTLYEV